MKNILITGGNGQLATCIKDYAQNLQDFHFTYVDIEDLDITNKGQVDAFFKVQNVAFCVNCAAYTAVDRAETDKEMSVQVNVDGTRYLAEACKTYGGKFIQISTDFVFDGNQSSLYTENDKPNPLGVYGTTKLDGELATMAALKEYYILRTSWLYSEYGHNFLKTMLRLGAERDDLGVVCDQIGTPTYAGDLAELVLKIIIEDLEAYGIYHYSNEGVASWYDFAKVIMDESAMACKVLPIRAQSYPTPAKRPTFSVMDKTKIKEAFNLEIPHWRDSLKRCLNIIHNNDCNKCVE